MDDSLHYLLMADHTLFQKLLFSGIRDTSLTLGQPKVLDYLSEHNGAIQKEIAFGCHIEPASLTSVLNGMEKKGLIKREMQNGNRRSQYIYMTEKGRNLSEIIKSQFEKIEEDALNGFSEDEVQQLLEYLKKIYINLYNVK